jgi:hypothetical protein
MAFDQAPPVKGGPATQAPLPSTNAGDDSLLTNINLQSLQGNVAGRINRAVESYADAVQKTELRHAMKTPDAGMWGLVLEVFFGGLPALRITREILQHIGATYELDVSSLEKLLKHDDAVAVVDGIKDAGKAVALGSMTSANGDSLDSFFDSLIDTSRLWAQAMTDRVFAATDKKTLLTLAAKFDQRLHTVQSTARRLKLS